MIHFKPAPHTTSPGDIVEIWQDDVFIGAVYPFGDKGIRVISKYLGTRIGIVVETQRPAAIVIQFEQVE